MSPGVYLHRGVYCAYKRDFSVKCINFIETCLSITQFKSYGVVLHFKWNKTMYIFCENFLSCKITNKPTFFSQ